MLMESNSLNHPLPGNQQVPIEPETDSQPAKVDCTWITNEAILRDEGALYGIASADITDKLQAIASYFQTKLAAPLQKKEFIQQRIQELSLVTSVNNAEVERIEELLEGQKAAPNNMLPLFLQFVAVTAVCVFNFFLLQWWLNPVIKSDMICLGIYLAGLFSVYIGRGLTYSLSETSEPANEETAGKGRRTFLKEFAVAAAVAGFICTLTSDAYPLKNNIAAAVIFFLLFLVGKVLLNTFSAFRQQAAIYFRFAANRYRHRREQRLLIKKNESAEASLQTARTQLQEPETIIKKLEAEQEYKTRVFLSEYHLALESRQMATKLPGKQFA
jgi:hypothetical protein